MRQLRSPVHPFWLVLFCRRVNDGFSHGVARSTSMVEGVTTVSPPTGGQTTRATTPPGTASAPIPIHRTSWTSHDIDLAARDLDLELPASPYLSVSPPDISPPAEPPTPPESNLYHPPPHSGLGGLLTKPLSEVPAHQLLSSGGVRPPNQHHHHLGAGGGPLLHLAQQPPPQPQLPSQLVARHGFVPPSAHRQEAQQQANATMAATYSCGGGGGEGETRPSSAHPCLTMATTNAAAAVAAAGITTNDACIGMGCSRSLPNATWNCGRARMAPPPAPRFRPSLPHMMPPKLSLPPRSPTSDLDMYSRSLDSSEGVSMITTSHTTSPSAASAPQYVQVGFLVGATSHTTPPTLHAAEHLLLKHQEFAEYLVSEVQQRRNHLGQQQVRHEVALQQPRNERSRSR